MGKLNNIDEQIKTRLQQVTEGIKPSEKIRESITDKISRRQKIRKKKIAILFGGCSPEYKVSLQSAYAIIKNMDRDKYAPVLLGITRDGEWYRYYGKPEKIRDDTWTEHPNQIVPAMFSPDKKDHGIIEFTTCNYMKDYSKTYIDAAFPVLHGKNGEDGTVQGIIELSGIPLIGCGILASALGMDKDRAHKLVKTAGIAVPEGFVLDAGKCNFNWSQSLDEKILAHNKMTFPLFVKPLKAGSSFGISKVNTLEELQFAAEKALRYDSKIIIEEAIDGFEVGCAVIGTEAIITGELDEIELTADFFDYTEKYTLETSKIHVPARLSEEKTEEIKDIAIRIYQVLGCSGFARVDMFLTADGKVIFNEVNTIPGFTTHSRYPGMMMAAGFTFSQIVNSLIGEVVGQ